LLSIRQQGNRRSDGGFSMDRMLGLILFATVLMAQDGLPPRGTLNDLAWIAGHWQCDVWGGKGEEIWTSPGAGTMLGMFRHFAGDKVTVYELMEFQQDGSEVVLRMKHFGKSLLGREEKDDSVLMPMRNWNGREARFETANKDTEITYTKISDTKMELILRRTRSGKADQVVFQFTRKPGA
jgi:hypothetical protein